MNALIVQNTRKNFLLTTQPPPHSPPLMIQQAQEI